MRDLSKTWLDTSLFRLCLYIHTAQSGSRVRFKQVLLIQASSSLFGAGFVHVAFSSSCLRGKKTCPFLTFLFRLHIVTIQCAKTGEVRDGGKNYLFFEGVPRLLVRDDGLDASGTRESALDRGTRIRLSHRPPCGSLGLKIHNRSWWPESCACWLGSRRGCVTGRGGCCRANGVLLEWLPSLPHPVE